MMEDFNIWETMRFTPLEKLKLLFGLHNRNKYQCYLDYGSGVAKCVVDLNDGEYGSVLILKKKDFVICVEDEA